MGNIFKNIGAVIEDRYLAPQMFGWVPGMPKNILSPKDVKDKDILWVPAYTRFDDGGDRDGFSLVRCTVHLDAHGDVDRCKDCAMFRLNKHGRKICCCASTCDACSSEDIRCAWFEGMDEKVEFHDRGCSADTMMHTIAALAMKDD